MRHHHFGEGEYKRLERIIQQLLAEAGSSNIGDKLVAVDGQGIEAAPDWHNLRSSENYVGYNRTENFASPGGPIVNEPQVYAAPAQLRLNQWALVGDWTMGHEATVLNEANGRIVYSFHGLICIW